MTYVFAHNHMIKKKKHTWMGLFRLWPGFRIQLSFGKLWGAFWVWILVFQDPSFNLVPPMNMIIDSSLYSATVLFPFSTFACQVSCPEVICAADWTFQSSYHELGPNNNEEWFPCPDWCLASLPPLPPCWEWPADLSDTGGKEQIAWLDAACISAMTGSSAKPAYAYRPTVTNVLLIALLAARIGCW